jgi:trimethylguanosine synthase
MWYSVTPEVIAHHVADKLIRMVVDCRRKQGDDVDACKRKEDDDEIVILDAFCGCGGNAIAFAKKNNVKVIAVDNDLGRLKMAANNARVYGIDDKDIVFVHADVVDVLISYKQGSKCLGKSDAANVQMVSGYRIGGLELLSDAIDAIFLSPPWGGMGYENNDTFDPISSITIESRREDGQTSVMNGGELFYMSAKAVLDAKNNGTIAYFLPRNVDGIKVGQIAVASGMDHECFELEQNVVNGKVKTVTAYFGNCLTKSTAP